MDRGEVIADRFEIEHPSGTGGMGQIYRARDRRSGEVVAVKVLHQMGPIELERFTREAEVLSTLQHPGIVRYIEGGSTPKGEPYLIMEWLDGETLSERMRRRQLTMAESLSLGVRVALALESIHRRGVVHRDLKPSNLFLRGGAVDQIVLIDFGIAWRTDAAQKLTLPGALIGTPGYIAPEQARGVPDIDARADVFSLGCVLFRCIAGRAPFQGDDPLAVLLKVAAADPPRLREIRPNVPPDLDDLVARMLSKSRDDRPADGGAAAAELLALEDSAPFSSGVISVPAPAPAEITAVERRVMSLVLARRRPGTEEPTLAAADAGGRERALRAVTERHKGQLSVLADGSLLVLLAGASVATDLAARAARCALAVRGLLDGGAVVVVSGRGLPGPLLPTGELIDSAVQLLGETPDGAPIRTDEVTAGLVAALFDAEPLRAGSDDGDGPVSPRGTPTWILRGERSEPDGSRPLLGRPTACVGRERELVQIEAAFDQCVEERMAVALLVTAAAGLGKSRLCHELLRKLRARGEPVEIWLGRGDPMSAGSAFGLLGHALRRAAGIADGEPLAARRDKLRARVARSVANDPGEVAELLGDLVGTSFSDDAPPQNGHGSGEGREDPVARGERVRRAFLAFLRAECAAHPVVLVLEDLHWGDLPTVRFVDAALAELREQPLMVLATGRPEVAALFPRLWASRGLQEIRLRELPRRACERLVRQVLGDAIGDDTLEAIVTRADGHAFYLEELIRAAAEGRGRALPETVLAMVQARLERLDPEARRVLRAASVFGETFWKAGVEALLGSTGAAPWLAELTSQEVIVPAEESRFPATTEHRFRHAIVREAAYGMLHEADRALGHELAGAWLEAAGETDAMALAEHFERGRVPERAVAWFERAAEQALEGGDLDAVVARADRALAGGASGPARGALLSMQGYVHVWRADNAAAAAAYHAALADLPAGSVHWYLSMGGALHASANVGEFDRLAGLVASLEHNLGAGGDPLPAVPGMTTGVAVLCMAGEHDLARAFLARLVPAGATVGAPLSAAAIDIARCHFACFAEGDFWSLRAHAAAALARGEGPPAPRVLHMARLYEGVALVKLGFVEEGERILRAAWEEAPAAGLQLVAQLAEVFLAASFTTRGALDDAEALMLASRSADPASVIFGALRAIVEARVARKRGRLDEAAATARAAARVLDHFSPGYTAEALAVLARVEHDRGDAAAALSAGRRAVALIDLIGTWWYDTSIRAGAAEALYAAGDRDLARRVVADALAQVEARAAQIDDPVYRERFVDHVSTHLFLRDRARRWSRGGEEAP
jgi:tetratricopeptide (TPR) repeat protein